MVVAYFGALIDEFGGHFVEVRWCRCFQSDRVKTKVLSSHYKTIQDKQRNAASRDRENAGVR